MPMNVHDLYEQANNQAVNVVRAPQNHFSTQQVKGGWDDDSDPEEYPIVDPKKHFLLMKRNQFDKL